MIRRALFGAGARRGTAFAAALVLAAALPIGSGDLQVAMFGDPPNRWPPEGRRYVAGSAAELPAAGAIRLEPAGAARQLPPGICGASSEPLIERLIGNQAKVAALKEIAPAILRFPGGSQSNFYDWKTGLLDFHENPQSSQYIKFWARIAPKIAATFPKGIHLEDFMPLVREVGADVILVPNLETSTVESQAAWFKHLAAEGILPKNIELGNEFWIAMGNDPDSLRRWPDEPAAMAVMHRYEQALRPIVGPGAKFAVQAAGHAFWASPQAREGLLRRLSDWDRALHPESWFEAVTIHLYPLLEPLQRLPAGDTHEGLFRYLMARCDGGVDRTIQSVSSRVPGKEIWITEWSAHDAGSYARRGPDPVAPPMFAQVATRMLLAFLRHPDVTRELFFTLNFTPERQSHFVAAADGSWRPEPATQVLGWFNHAASGGARYQRVIERGTSPASPGVSFGDSYREVEGAVFVSAGQTTLILQNAGAAARTFDPTDAGRLPAPKSVQIIAASDLNDSERRAAQVNTVSTPGPFTLPPYSVVRVIWPAEVKVTK
jgi:hypothetical protein